MKIFLITVFALLSCNSIFGQAKTDTIYVNMKQTTYVVCKDSIEWFEVGSKEYAGKILGTTFFLKPKTQGTSSTSLLIKTGENHIYKTIVYSDKLSKTLYDLKDEQDVKGIKNPVAKNIDKKAPEDNNVDSSATINIHNKGKTYYTNALLKFIEISDPFKSIAVSKERIVLSLGNAKAVENEVLLKYNVANYSGHRFNIDQYEIFFINQSGHLLGSDTAFDTPIEPIVEHIVKYVDPSQRGILGFVLPLEFLNTKGKILLRLKENPGKKNIVLEVPNSLYQKN